MPKFDLELSPVLLAYPGWLWFLPGQGVRYYSLLLLAAVSGGYWLFAAQLQRAARPRGEALDFLPRALIGMGIGARLAHLLFYDFDTFRQTPEFAFRVWQGGLASHGAVLGFGLALWGFYRNRGADLIDIADRAVFAGALGATLVRIGNFTNSELVGRITDQSWGVKFLRYDDWYRHPVQLYEAALGAFLLISLYIVDRQLGKEQRVRGTLASLFFAVYFTGRIGLEFLKEPESTSSVWLASSGLGVIPAFGLGVLRFINSAGFNTAQWLSFGPALLGFWGLSQVLRKSTRRVSAV